MDNIRKTANNRSEFARIKYEEILKSFTITKSGNVIDTIAGYKARKLAQAYRIYCYYAEVFSGEKQRGTAVYKVQENNLLRRKKNRDFKSRRYLLQQSA